LTEKIFRVIYQHPHPKTVWLNGGFAKLPGGGDRSMTEAIKATREVVTNYCQLFVNRGACTVPSIRPHPETGQHYNFRPTKEGTDRPPVLTEGTIILR